MERPYVLAFVGQNANGILRWLTEKILAGLDKHGYGYRLIDLLQPDWQTQLSQSLAARKPAFGFSTQGFGANIQTNGQNLWSRAGIPFVTCLGDNPYHAPNLHIAPSPGGYLLYTCADFLQTYRQFLGGSAYATTARFACPENPAADRTPWKRRKHELVFVKTGVNSQGLRQRWESFPNKIRDILSDSAALVLSGADETVANLCARVFDDRQIHWGDRRELFFSVCSQVDFYARAVRAERMVLALMRHNAVIVGDWSHLDRSGARARFVQPIPAEQLDDLYAETKILVNTLPAVRFGLHERILAGLFSQAAVLSDTTPFVQEALRDCPSFLGVDIDREDFPDSLNDAVNSCLADPAMPDKIRVSTESAQNRFSFDGFIQEILDHVALESYRKELDWWVSPAVN